VELDNYWTATSKESDYKLKPGTYRLAAQLAGFIETGNQVTFRSFQPIAGRSFDKVNPEIALACLPCLIHYNLRLQSDNCMSHSGGILDARCNPQPHALPLRCLYCLY
jgi:hypothetical protein